MPDKGLHVQQNENVDRGRLQVNVTSTLGLQPVVNARVGIAYTGESQRLLEELETDSSGQTEAVTLDAPPVEYSQEPDRPQPFSEYTPIIDAIRYGIIISINTSRIIKSGVAMDAALNSLICFANVLIIPFTPFLFRFLFYSYIYNSDFPDYLTSYFFTF